MYEPEGTHSPYDRVFSFLNKYFFAEIETEKIKDKNQKYCGASQNNSAHKLKKTLFGAHFHNNDIKIKLKWFDKLRLKPIAFGGRFALLSCNTSNK